MTDSDKNSPHLEDRGARAVDITYDNLTRDQFKTAHDKTKFLKQNFKDDYKDGHTHVALPHLQKYYPSGVKKKKDK